jgi:outer membrane immunogenic protein
MKKLLLSTTALFTMTAMAAAADLPARTMAPAPAPVFAAPVFTWSGFYAGINGGYVWDETRARLRGTTGLTPAQNAFLVGAGNGDLDDEGFTIGGHVGGNMQFGIFVAGIEADIAYTDIARSRALAIPGGVFTPAGVAGTFTAQSDLEFLGTVRGRIGLAFDRFMVYGTGGLAYGGVNSSFTANFPAGPAFNTNGGVDDVQVGYAVGVGGEYAFTNNLVLGVEYLYYDLEDQNVTVGPAGANATYRVTHTGDILRGRLSFKF